MLFMSYDTESKSRNVLASPLGEEGHEVAKGCARVRMIMILLFCLSVLCPVHPFPLRGTSPQGETRDMERKTGESYTSCTIPVFPPLVAGATTFPPQAGALQGSAKPCTHKSLYFKHGVFCPCLRGMSGAAGKGGERSEPFSRKLIMPYDTESKSRNADFISIARRAIHNPRGQRPRQT